VTTPREIVTQVCLCRFYGSAWRGDLKSCKSVVVSAFRSMMPKEVRVC
jgi:hypothetical protein